MTDSELVASYKNGLNKVLLYADRIELGCFGLKYYRYDEIKSANFTYYIIQTSLSLELWDGNKSDVIQMYNNDAKACKPLLQKYINNSQLTSGDTVAVQVGCTFLGGTGVEPLVTGSVCQVAFFKNAVCILSGGHRISIELNHLKELKLEGPGQVTTNAGVIGGGFGLEGAIIGIGAAALLNSLTTNTTTNTILYLGWAGAEMFLHTSDFSPEQGRILLSQAFTAIQSGKNNADSDLASQIERLVMLKNSGVLTEEEFQLGKAKLLGMNN